MPDWFWYVVVFGYGAIVGSFLNVLIYRMPLGISVVSPPSRCPHCHTSLGFWDNIPLLSFLALGARCRYCGAPISWRYFCVELLTGSLWVCLFWRLSGETGISWANFVAHALFASLLVAVIFIDLDHFLIPDELNWAGIGVGVARDALCLALAWQAGSYLWEETAPLFLYFGWLPRSLVGAAVYGGLLFLVSLLAFLYYAREEGEPVARTARRFFVYEEEPGERETGVTAPPSQAGEDGSADEPEQGEPVRLRFSPAFLAAASALLLLPVLGAWALLAFAVPLLAFIALSRRGDEPVGAALPRFFRADDAGMPETPEGDAAPDDNPEAQEASLLAAEADQFAREAETGQHGGMGLGDVKLALAIGALLGPGLAILSLFFATAAGAVVGISLAAVHGKGLRIGVPFGPFMALGAVVTMLFGSDLVTWYLRLTGLR